MAKHDVWFQALVYSGGQISSRIVSKSAGLGWRLGLFAAGGGAARRGRLGFGLLLGLAGRRRLLLGLAGRLLLLGLAGLLLLLLGLAGRRLLLLGLAGRRLLLLLLGRGLGLAGRRCARRTVLLWVAATVHLVVDKFGRNVV